MATLIHLTGTKALVKIDPSLEPGELEHRLVYATPFCWNRIENELSGYVSTWKIEDTPVQQLDALLEVFCSGETLTFDRRFKPLNHLGRGIWELKTADLRLFGWFAHKDCFVATTIDLASRIKKHNLYPGWSGDAVRQRDLLDLDHPKFVPGIEPSDVVANYDFP